MGWLVDGFFEDGKKIVLPSRKSMPNHPNVHVSSLPTKKGFTLMEVILVMVLIVVISGISLPYFASSFRGSKLRTSARTINRMAKYANSMAIMREETLTLALNPDTMEVFLGGYLAAPTNSADGELDQDVLKRLGFVDDDESSSPNGGIEKEVHRFLPDGLTVKDFEKEWAEADDEHDELHLVRFFPNGQCEWFKLELADDKGDGVLLEIDPISAKMTSEFTQ
jgi:prepilin-type N-terminal cleavage/methylation domain-containing protein